LQALGVNALEKRAGVNPSSIKVNISFFKLGQ